jgi:hypothetical protein
VADQRSDHRVTNCDVRVIKQRETIAVAALCAMHRERTRKWFGRGSICLWNCGRSLRWGTGLSHSVGTEQTKDLMMRRDSRTDWVLRGWSELWWIMDNWFIDFDLLARACQSAWTGSNGVYEIVWCVSVAPWYDAWNDRSLFHLFVYSKR